MVVKRGVIRRKITRRVGPGTVVDAQVRIGEIPGSGGKRLHVGVYRKDGDGGLMFSFVVDRKEVKSQHSLMCVYEETWPLFA